MSLPTSIGAYKEELDVLDRAHNSSSGIRVPVANTNAATHFRMRLHSARSIDRRKNSQIYQPDHPLYNASIYDPLVVTIAVDDGVTYIYIQRSQYVMGAIEDLSGEIEGETFEEPAKISHEPRVVEDLEDDFAPAGGTDGAVRRRV